MPDTKNERPFDTPFWSYYGHAEENALWTLKRLEGICKAIKAKRRGTTGSDVLTLRDICEGLRRARVVLAGVVLALEDEDHEEERDAREGR